VRTPRKRTPRAGNRLCSLATKGTGRTSHKKAHKAHKAHKGKHFCGLCAFLWLVSEHVHHGVVDEAVAGEDLFVVDVDGLVFEVRDPSAGFGD